MDSTCRLYLHQEPWWTLGVGSISTKSSALQEMEKKLAYYIKTKWLLLINKSDPLKYLGGISFHGLEY